MLGGRVLKVKKWWETTWREDLEDVDHFASTVRVEGLLDEALEYICSATYVCRTMSTIISVCIPQ